MQPTERELEEARAALAPTLAATAAILPWVAKAKAPRFPATLAGRWQDACQRAKEAWGDYSAGGTVPLRSAVFELCALAVDIGDLDCLRLSEALASAHDHLDLADGEIAPRLRAAISAALEFAAEDGSLQHDLFSARAQHFAARLEQGWNPSAPTRAVAVDRWIAAEIREHLSLMGADLDRLPPDAYGLKVHAADLGRLANALEMRAIANLTGALVRLLTIRAGESVDLEDGANRMRILDLMGQLDEAAANLLAESTRPP